MSFFFHANLVEKLEGSFLCVSIQVHRGLWDGPHYFTCDNTARVFDQLNPCIVKSE